MRKTFLPVDSLHGHQMVEAPQQNGVGRDPPCGCSIGYRSPGPCRLVHRRRGIVDVDGRPQVQNTQASEHRQHEQAERGWKTARLAGNSDGERGDARSGNDPDEHDIDREHSQPQPAPPRDQIDTPGLDRLDRGRERQQHGHGGQDLAATLAKLGPGRPAERHRKSDGHDGQPQDAMPSPEHEIVVEQRARPQPEDGGSEDRIGNVHHNDDLGKTGAVTTA